MIPVMVMVIVTVRQYTREVNVRCGTPSSSLDGVLPILVMLPLLTPTKVTCVWLMSQGRVYSWSYVWHSAREGDHDGQGPLC